MDQVWGILLHSENTQHTENVPDVNTKNQKIQ